VGIKLNIGASPIWSMGGWCTLDHKLKERTEFSIPGDALSIDLPNDSCDVIFCSHVFEHIPHVKLPLVIAEINRVLKSGGIFRMLTPNLRKIAEAYVREDKEFFVEALEEDETIRTDLGFGGMLMNFIVSPGQDTVLIDRGLTDFIAGYAHLYSYDFKMLQIMFEKLGFSAKEVGFCSSEIEEMQVPLHVIGLEKKWQNFNQKFYTENNLVHRLANGKYEINFKVTGFDRDPLTSLIIEAKKIKETSKNYANAEFNQSTKNYNRYAWSLLTGDGFRQDLESKKINYPK
jgi:SAM-dependent methyltransferase